MSTQCDTCKSNDSKCTHWRADGRGFIYCQCGCGVKVVNSFPPSKPGKSGFGSAQSVIICPGGSKLSITYQVAKITNQGSFVG